MLKQPSSEVLLRTTCMMRTRRFSSSERASILSDPTEISVNGHLSLSISAATLTLATGKSQREIPYSRSLILSELASAGTSCAAARERIGVRRIEFESLQFAERGGLNLAYALSRQAGRLLLCDGFERSRCASGPTPQPHYDIEVAPCRERTGYSGQFIFDRSWLGTDCREIVARPA